MVAPMRVTIAWVTRTERSKGNIGSIWPTFRRRVF
jgi:hypothetical protein